jgi:hypothetical protein
VKARLLSGLVPIAVVAVLWGLWSSAQAQVASITLPSPGTTKQLYSGCNNVSLTFPDGTPSQDVIQAVTPAESVQSMWRHNAALGKFEGFSPAAPQASDLLTVNLWDAVWLCVGGVPPTAPTAPPVSPPAPTATPIPPPAAALPGPVAGATYTGPHSGGGTITFVVSADGRSVEHFTVVTLTAPCLEAISIEIGPPIPIQSNSFVFRYSATTVSGDFPTKGTAQGVFEMRDWCTLSWSATTSAPVP